MSLRLAALLIPALWAAPAAAQGDPHQHQHHQHHDHQPQHHGHGQAPHHGQGHLHSHEIGPPGATYDLRWLDAMVQHHSGALRMSERVFHIGVPGVGALAHQIWDEQAREIKAMLQWRQAWYPDAPDHPVSLRPGGDPGSMADLQRMTPAQIEALQMVGSLPSRTSRVRWFLEGMIAHHGGALEMAEDAQRNTRNATLLRLASDIIASQSQEIDQLRNLLRRDGGKPPE